ncbi:MAG TPA: hypothetical protein VGV37_29575 [Aliidongia sp.]|uniref:hypothetical protein n=1 Tax=Aliidongia sp. TaxID=1914230 RepID=UPI002DDCD1D3|nr:hypothetical protein [Aliidongia sp.]HEV2678715.1 hypothetical protein [Aliidongia sp.]
MNGQEEIRNVLRSLSPSVAHRAADKPNVADIYSPPHHANALDPNRTLVVGGRGVGKSFWASVLFNEEARAAAAQAYPFLGLENLDVVLGFYEGAMGSENVAPSASTLKAALKIADDPASIWRSVILKRLAPEVGPSTFNDRVRWIEGTPEAFEDALLEVDQRQAAEGRTLLILFDALDVLATDWDSIRTLTRGLARLALELSARKAIRLKMFMRRDQFEDMRRKTFADFSKLRTAAVELNWKPEDLYGVLFTRIWRDQAARPVLAKLGAGLQLDISKPDLPESVKVNPTTQEALFATIAGEFMGTNKKRGRTYTWMPKHLADAHNETSLRSFLISLKEAADRSSSSIETAIDHVGINAGVLKASDTRLEELREDHPWVDDALNALSGLTVPCAEGDVTDLWREAGTVGLIVSRTNAERPAAPIQLDAPEFTAAPEKALLEALIDLAVIERRSADIINVPDIFRVAAKIKRRGGIAPRRER